MDSTVEVEACVGSTCGAPWSLTVANCCQAQTTCQVGMCGDAPNGCGGIISCGGCTGSQECVGGLCEDTGAQGACEAAGGTWVVVNGHGTCIKVKCGAGGKLCQ